MIPKKGTRDAIFVASLRPLPQGIMKNLLFIAIHSLPFITIYYHSLPFITSQLLLHDCYLPIGSSVAFRLMTFDSVSCGEPVLCMGSSMGFYAGKVAQMYCCCCHRVDDSKYHYHCHCHCPDGDLNEVLCKMHTLLE